MKSVTTNENKWKTNDSKSQHESKTVNSRKSQKTALDPNDSILSSTSDGDICSPVQHTNPRTIRKFMEHAEELQQLSEMDANLQHHIAQGGILHLATLNIEADDHSNAESSVIESACVDISEKRLKNIMGPVGVIQLIPPLLSMTCQRLVPPSWDAQTLDSLPSPLLYPDLPFVKNKHKLDLIHEAVYGSNLLRSMRVKQSVLRCVSLSKDKPFFSFDILFRVITHLTNDKTLLKDLARACNLKVEVPEARTNDITVFNASSIPITEINLDIIWHSTSLQLETSPSCYSREVKSFLLAFALLLAVDGNLDLRHTSIRSCTSSLFETADLSVLKPVLRAVMGSVTHHHTLLRLCSSVMEWKGNAAAFQAWIALCVLSGLPRDSYEDQLEAISDLDDIYSLVPDRVLLFLGFALSDRNMDQHCDFYQLHSELHILYILLKFSHFSWSPEQLQSLKDSLQLLSKMFRKYSLNLDGIKIKECIRLLISRVDMEC